MIAPLTRTALDRFAVLLGSLCKAGDIICLEGELGAGKTTLTQALARGAGIDDGEYVSSPTFAYMHEYKGNIPLYHMDFYRLGTSDDILELGLDEYFYRSGITIIEWPERAAEVIPETSLLLHLQIIDLQHRKITMSGSDHCWKERITVLSDAWPDPS